MTKHAQTDQLMVAMFGIGIIAADNADSGTFARLYGLQLMSTLNDATIRKALKFIYERDGGDIIIRQLIKHLRPYAGRHPPCLQLALEALQTSRTGEHLVRAADVPPRAKLTRR
jgi:hypothetical protein